MATYNSDMVAGNQSFKPFPSGALGVRYAKFTATTAIALNDVIQMVDVFAGETVHDVKIKTGDLDTGTALVLDVGREYSGNIAEIFSNSEFLLSSKINRKGHIKILKRSSNGKLFSRDVNSKNGIEVFLKNY